MKKQKFQALLVALCMLVSVIPAMTAPAAQATDPATQVIKLVAPETDMGLDKFDIDVNGWEINQSKTHGDVWGDFSNTGAVVAYTSFTKLVFGQPNEFVAIDFKVNESGYYNIALVTNDYGGYTTEVSTTIDGTAMNNVKWLGDNTTDNVKNLGGKYLTAGVHTLVMKAVANQNYIFFSALNLTKTEAPKVEAGYSKTIPLKGDTNTNNFGVATIEGYGWEIDEETTTAGIYNDMMSSASSKTYDNWIYASSLKLEMSDGADVGIAFMVDKTGYYDLSVAYTAYSGNWAASAHVYVDDICVGSIDSNDIDGDPNGTLTNIALKKQVYLEAGRHVFVLHRSSSTRGKIIMNSFTTTASAVQEAAAETPFGYRYALVKNSAADADEQYSLFVISAIDGVDYKNAGFDLVVNGATKTETTKNVYNQFNFTNAGAGNLLDVVRPVDFGCNDGYIYYVEYKLSAEEVNAAMEITAFVTDAKDKKISGKTVAVAAK